jgi:hypothetical protein
MNNMREYDNATSFQVIDEKLNGLSRLIEEKFVENNNGHQAIWEQVRKTNGTVRLHEKIIWALGGALAMMSPTAITTLVNLLTR